MSDYAPLRMFDKWPIGDKHRGELIEDILRDDPDYLLWARTALKRLKLAEDVHRALDRELDKKTKGR